MKTKKYIFWYKSDKTVYCLYARNLKHLLKLLDERGMKEPNRVEEDCNI
jgi:hypothetical protein